MSTGRVLIIGGGIGGLALAQGLKNNGIPFTVFERDATPEARPQGYRIKIFADTAADLKYVLSAELWADFEATCAETGMGETTFNALDATVIASRVNRGPKPYTVDRGVLRSVLMKGLGDDLQWNKTFLRYELSGDEVVAHFADGTTEKGSLLVGVDGSRSPVRKQYLPSQHMVDTEGVVIFGKTVLTPELEARFPAKALRWISLFRDTPPVLQEIIIGHLSVTLLVEAMRFPAKDARDEVPPDYVYWALLVPKKLLGPTDEILEKVLAQPPMNLSLMVSSEWDPAVRSVLELQDASQTSALRVFSAPSKIPAWETNGRVTLMGDAIHVMSPAGGVGAVTALKDAATLLEVLVEKGLSDSSIASYEAGMREYASASIARSFAGANKLYGMPPFEQCKVVDL
ncbi:hypothetical protein MMC10_000878 [Thelotrema lepadinum]|nr:hypothetical protein [Thelotrema lepadinum]